MRGNVVQYHHEVPVRLWQNTKYAATESYHAFPNLPSTEELILIKLIYVLYNNISTLCGSKSLNR